MMSRTEARAILAACNVPLGADFHTLPASAVDSLMEHARAHRYKAPAANRRNGSPGRYWHAYLQRRAADRAFAGFVAARPVAQ